MSNEYTSIRTVVRRGLAPESRPARLGAQEQSLQDAPPFPAGISLHLLMGD